MAYQSIGLGSTADDGTGDTLRAGGDKVNDNFVEVYTLLGTGSALSSGISATATVVTLTAPTISGVVGGTQTSATITTLTTTTVTASGVITGSTVEATGDTSASDNAAIGYTSAEGLILTGQGSTSDITIKNDADAAVITVATGTTNVDVVGDLTAGTLNADGDTAAGDNATIGYTASEGLILTGQGSTNDVTIKNDADATVISIPTGATNVDVVGDLTAGTLNADGDTAAGDNAVIGYTSAEGLILAGQGSTSDITIKNDADAAVITVATGTTNVDVVGEVSAESFNLPITLNGTDGSSTDAGDNIVLDASASGVNVGERLLYEGIPTTIPDDAVTLAMMAGGTDGHIITYDASGDPTTVGPGTDGQVLTSTGAGSPPAFEAAGGGGEWQFAATGTFSSASTVDFTGLTGDTKFVFEDISVGTDNKNIYCLLSNDNGSTFETSYMNFITSWTSNSSAADSWYGSGSFIGCTNGGVGSGAGEGAQGWIILHNPQDSGKFTHASLLWSADTFLDHINFSVGASCRQVAEAIDALRVYPASGTFSGTWYKYTRITS